VDKGDPDGELAPELMRYLNRDYWEQKEREKAESKKQVETKVTAATGGSSFSQAQPMSAVMQPDMQPPLSAVSAIPIVTHNLPPALAGGANDPELDEFVTTLRTQVEIFVNRMKSNSSRGRSITNDSSVQTLFMNTMAMHSKLLKHIQDQEDRRVYYEGLQDKIAQVKDARAALDALREEERERKRREAEEAERLRQIQMREKLEVMRKKKQEYLQYQRQVALQRMQEQEREMKLRQEQAMQQVQANQMPLYNNMMMPGYPRQPGVPGHGMAPGAPMPGAYPGMQPPYMHYQPYPMGPSGPIPGAGPMHGAAPQAPASDAGPAFNMQSMAGALPHASMPPPNQGAMNPNGNQMGGMPNYSHAGDQMGGPNYHTQPAQQQSMGGHPQPAQPDMGGGPQPVQPAMPQMNTPQTGAPDSQAFQGGPGQQGVPGGPGTMGPGPVNPGFEGQQQPVAPPPPVAAEPSLINFD